MSEDLFKLTEEVRARLEGMGVEEGGRPALLGCDGSLCAMLTPEGLEFRPVGTVQAPSGPWDLTPLIDHTLLKPEAKAEDVDKLCREATKHGFASVCVNPTWVPLAAAALRGHDVRVCTVVGFPLGATTTRTKVFEAEEAMEAGAHEIDMVLNLGWAKEARWKDVERELEEMRKVVRRGRHVLKLILETSALNRFEKLKACEVARYVGVDFVKTSTGFGAGGATVEDVQLMRGKVGLEIGVKASGGIRDYNAALKMVLAGATRLGTSASLAIAKGESAAAQGY